MNIQRASIGGVSILGFLMLFLPWATISNKFNGTKLSVGIAGFYMVMPWLVALLFLAIVVLMLLWGPDKKNLLQNRLAPVDRQTGFVVAGLGGAAFLFSIIALAIKNSTKVPYSAMKKFVLKACDHKDLYEGTFDSKKECREAALDHLPKKSDYDAKSISDLVDNGGSAGAGFAGIFAILLAIAVVALVLVFMFMVTSKVANQNIAMPGFAAPGAQFGGAEQQFAQGGQFGGQPQYGAPGQFPAAGDGQYGAPAQYGTPGQFPPAAGYAMPGQYTPGQFPPATGGQVGDPSQQFPPAAQPPVHPENPAGEAPQPPQA